jgi:hypothetical protein
MRDETQTNPNEVWEMNERSLGVEVQRSDENFQRNTFGSKCILAYCRSLDE